MSTVFVHTTQRTRCAHRYLVNYAPFDCVYRACKIKPVKLIIYTLKEIQRANKVSNGVTWAMTLYPGSYAIVCIIGIVKGKLAFINYLLI